MKKLFILLLAVAAFSSCHRIKGSGHVVKETRSAAGFKNIEASTGIRVELRKGDFSVVSETDDNLQRYLRTRVDGNTLKIYLESNNLSISGSGFVVYVSAPMLNKIKCSSAASIEALDVLENPEKIILDASSAASITAEVDAPSVTVETSSAATANIKGRTKDLKLDASSGASLNAEQLLSENANASSSSGATVHVQASVQLDASASSGGNISYKGDPALKSHSSSGGSISRE